MATNAKNADPTKLEEMRFDYAWKWFSYHADQRIKMFNYMLVVFGIFAASTVNALDKHLPIGVVASLCFGAAVLAFIFTRLDKRNRDLVWMAEDILIELEREVIFGANATITGNRGPDKGQSIRYGLQQRQEAGPSIVRDALQGKHRVLLPGIGYLIAVLFLVAGIWIIVWPPVVEKSKDCLVCTQAPQQALPAPSPGQPAARK